MSDVSSLLDSMGSVVKQGQSPDREVSWGEIYKEIKRHPVRIYSHHAALPMPGDRVEITIDGKTHWVRILSATPGSHIKFVGETIKESDV
jgi:hypothetical protein